MVVMIFSTFREIILCLPCVIENGMANARRRPGAAVFLDKFHTFYNNHLI